MFQWTGQLERGQEACSLEKVLSSVGYLLHCSLRAAFQLQQGELEGIFPLVAIQCYTMGFRLDAEMLASKLCSSVSSKKIRSSVPL